MRVALTILVLQVRPALVVEVAQLRMLPDRLAQIGRYPQHLCSAEVMRMASP